MSSDAIDNRHARQLAKSYMRANVLFPQTRFYFIIDFCTKLSTEELSCFSAQRLEFGGIDQLTRFVAFANKHHTKRAVSKDISIAHIERDTNKMLEALRGFIDRLGGGKSISSDTALELRQQFMQLKLWIDTSGISAEYLDFLSDGEPHDSDGRYSVVRVPSVLVQLLQQAPLSDALIALWPEIDKQVWAVRK